MQFGFTTVVLKFLNPVTTYWHAIRCHDMNIFSTDIVFTLESNCLSMQIIESIRNYDELRLVKYSI
jgi:hypothetical protein